MQNMHFSGEKYSHHLYLVVSIKRIDKMKKPASVLVVFLKKALNKIILSLCSKQVVVPSSLPVAVA